MTKKRLMVTLAAVLSLSLFGGLIGCGSRQPAEPATTQSGTAVETQAEAQGGVISLKVNPEIAVFYDENGAVTKIESRNDDGKKVITNYTGFEGKECRVVIGELIALINEAGYFVEETEGEAHQITLEIEEGSILPTENFLNSIVAEIQKYTSTEKINTPVAVNGESTYGWTNYGDTDYGPDNDGVTDYDDTDYGTTSDGVTDYDDKPASTSGTSNNTNSNKNTGNSGNSNYGNTNYGNTNYGNTNYGNTNYGNTDYGANSDGATNYDDGDSGYSSGQTTTTTKPSTSKPSTTTPSKPSNSGSAGNGDSGYDSGNSNYGSSDSGYDNSGDSGYDSGDSGYDGGDSGYDD